VCARATLRKAKLQDIAELVDAEFSADDVRLYRPRYNLAPSDVAWIVEARGDGRVLRPAVWGYLGSNGRPVINARGERVASGGGFRDAFAGRRSVVVTDGFYEWDAGHRPTWFHRADDGLVLLAALTQPPRTPTDAYPRFTVLTTTPNAVVGAVHDRMPVVIEAPHLDAWLVSEPAEAGRLIVPTPEHVLVATAVSNRVNSVRNDDPSCLASESDRTASRQQSLF
jgi:putative SOS response-associated peptidase YedK